MNNEEIPKLTSTGSLDKISTSLPTEPERLHLTTDKELTESKSALHTLEGDLFAAMKDDDYGNNIVKIVSNSHTNTNPTATFNSNKELESTFTGEKKEVFKKYAKYIILVLFVVTTVVIGILFYINKSKEKKIDANVSTATTVTASTTPVRKTAVINPEILQNLNISKLDKDDIIKEINKSKIDFRNSNTKSFTTVGYNLDVDIQKFFEKMRYSGPDSFLRALSDDYSFGIYTDQQKTFEPYLLIKVTSYDLAYAGLLNWESIMAEDLKGIFSKEKLLASSTASIFSSSTVSTSTKTGIREKIFTDQVIKNVDTRVYTDNDANLTLVYGFLNKQYILITGGYDSFIAVRNKFLTNNILR